MAMKWKTWANLVTGLGFAGIGFYVWAYLGDHREFVLPLLIATSLTDFFDGFLARKLNQETELGAAIDPIRDRLLLAAALGNLFSIYRLVDAELILFNIALFEIGILVVNAYRGLPQPVHVVGKIRMLLHLLALSLILFSYYYFPFLSMETVKGLVLFMLASSVATFIAYLFFPPKRKRRPLEGQ